MTIQDYEILKHKMKQAFETLLDSEALAKDADESESEAAEEVLQQREQEFLESILNLNRVSVISSIFIMNLENEYGDKETYIVQWNETKIGFKSVPSY